MKTFTREERLMGSSFSLGVCAETEAWARSLLREGVAEIKRIEALLSEFRESSDTSRINQGASDRPVVVQSESLELIKRCKAISDLTQGDFDITVGPLKDRYRFDNGRGKLPEPKSVRDVLRRVGYRKIEIDEARSTIRFAVRGMKIGFAAIGKGYASDMVKKLWMKRGACSGFINASGDLNAFGPDAEGEFRKTGIADPDDPGKVLLYVALDRVSVATSGDSQQFFESDGIRYSHNLNPHTGFPLTGTKSVSVFSPSAELSDALATAVYVKGPEAGISFINELPRSHCVVIDDRNRIFFSKNIKYETVPV